MFALALLVLLIWLWLAGARGGFWRVARPRAAPQGSEWPAVVAVIPARDEAEVIGRAIESLAQQDYPGDFSVIVVDDHSSDATSAVALAAARAAGFGERLQVIAARTLPPGWAGKVWAQSEGVAALEARGAAVDWVWFSDADIWHGPSVLRELVVRGQAEGRDLVSLMVRLRCRALPERALIPAFVFFFAMLYPFAWVNDQRRRTAAAAGGCMLVRRRALQRIGGMAAVRAALIDDCALAAAMKKGGSIRLDLASDSVSLRAYDSWASLWNMIARSAFTQLRHSLLLLCGTVAAMLLTYAAPLALSLVVGRDAWPALVAWGLMTACYIPILRYYRVSPGWALLLPAVALFYLGATLESARRYWSGHGGQWKGRDQAPRQA